jgi:hypothetical protein
VSDFKIAKVVETAIGGTWTAPQMADSTAAHCNSLAWFDAASLFIGGLSNGNVESSPDGDVWTNSGALPNAFERGQIATSATAAVMSTNGVGVATVRNKALRSTNGTSWAEVTLPSSSRWYGVAYSSQHERFLTVGASGVIAKSDDDGLNWSTSGIAAPSANTIRSVASHGNLWLAQTDEASNTSVLWVSDDNAASWAPVRAWANGGFGAANLVSTGQQIAFRKRSDSYVWCLSMPSGS